METHDITVVGGGPAGLFALFYAGLRGAKAQIIEALPELGGQLYALYPEKWIYDMPGIPAILARDLVRACTQQAMQWPHTVCLEENVRAIRGAADAGFEILTDKGAHRTKSIILCTGIGAFTPRKLAAPTAAQFEGRGLHYYAPDLQAFANRRVVIVGGGDSALDYALALTEVAQEIVLLHRSKFRAHPGTVERLAQTAIEVCQPDYEVQALHGENELQAITYVNRKTNVETTRSCDAVLAALGFVSDVDQLQAWGLKTDGKGLVVDPYTMETGIPGIFAAGDVISHDAKLKLIACGTSEAAIAVSQAMTYVRPGEKQGTIHSSNLTLPIAEMMAQRAQPEARRAATSPR